MEMDIIQDVADDFKLIRIVGGPHSRLLAACKLDHLSEISVYDLNAPTVPVPTRLTVPTDVHQDSALFRLSGHEQDGWGINWSTLKPSLLASGSQDSLICQWDINAAPNDKGCIDSLRTYRGHTGPVMDVHWNPNDGHLLLSASDDSTVRVWDTRENRINESAIEFKHGDQVNSCEWSHHDRNIFAAASNDGVVSVWDARASSTPLHSLACGMGTHDISRVSWASFQPNLLAASGNNRRIMIWDLARVGMAQSAEDALEGPPELAFIHGGHTSAVTEFDWSPDSPWTIASVADNNILQVWQMAETLRTAPKASDHPAPMQDGNDEDDDARD